MPDLHFGSGPSGLGKGSNSDNCALFTMSKVPSLPPGLDTWAGKLRAVNFQTPTVGSIAMIPYVDPKTNEAIGHAAYIEKVEGNSITVLEANFSLGNITRRTATGTSLNDAASRLNIAGYYRP
ncbi:MAG: CHAP domain-containing protein [Nitrosomonadales bacterium]|nr:CHAP domain-containing protein [Nitrosomonadales bacterium]